jgi:hypothetical protein
MQFFSLKKGFAPTYFEFLGLWMARTTISGGAWLAQRTNTMVRTRSVTPGSKRPRLVRRINADGLTTAT